MSCTLSLLTLCTLFFFFFNDTATTEIYTLSLHDALPISDRRRGRGGGARGRGRRVDVSCGARVARAGRERMTRSEEHTSELQSHVNLVCRLLLEKKKIKKMISNTTVNVSGF